MAVKHAKNDEMFVTTHVGDDIHTLLFKVSETAIYEPQFRPLREQLRHAVEASKACRGMPLAQLIEMNNVAYGALAKAYDVCSALDETFGADLVDDEEIQGSDAVDALAQLADTIRAVTEWAREGEGDGE